MIIAISIIVVCIISISFLIILTKLKLLSFKNNKIQIYNKIAKLQYNRLNNSDSINRNPFMIVCDDILENSYTVLDKIV